jgi:hypothetical protein
MKTIYMQNTAKRKIVRFYWMLHYLSCVLNMLSWVIRFVMHGHEIVYKVYKKKRNLGIS